MSKNPLAQNIREHSKLDDIAPDQDAGFEVEFIDAYIPEDESDKKRWKLTKGMHTLRAVDYDKIEQPTTEVNEFGEEYVKAPHYSIELVDVKGPDDPDSHVFIEFPITDKAERSFKLAINTRSKRDLARKIAPAKVTDLTVLSVCKYLAKFPCEFLYDKSTWVGEDGEYHTSRNPKVHIWMPEDFTNRKRSSNHISLR